MAATTKNNALPAGPSRSLQSGGRRRKQILGWVFWVVRVVGDNISGEQSTRSLSITTSQKICRQFQLLILMERRPLKHSLCRVVYVWRWWMIKCGELINIDWLTQNPCLEMVFFIKNSWNKPSSNWNDYTETDWLSQERDTEAGDDELQDPVLEELAGEDSSEDVPGVREVSSLVTGRDHRASLRHVGWYVVISFLEQFTPIIKLFLLSELERLTEIKGCQYNQRNKKRGPRSHNENIWGRRSIEMLSLKAINNSKA